VATTAQADRRAPCQSKRLALRVYNLKVTFNANIAVIIDNNLGSRHQVSGPRWAAQLAKAYLNIG